MKKIKSDEEKIKEWEKAFEKKMTAEERTMFSWGYAYGVEEAIRLLNKIIK